MAARLGNVHASIRPERNVSWIIQPSKGGVAVISRGGRKANASNFCDESIGVHTIDVIVFERCNIKIPIGGQGYTIHGAKIYLDRGFIPIAIGLVSTPRHGR